MRFSHARTLIFRQVVRIPFLQPFALKLTVVTGQLPYLTHGLHIVTGLHGIIQYITNLAHSNLYGSLSSIQKAQATTHVAHLEANMGDLVVSRSLRDVNEADSWTEIYSKV